MEEKSRRREKKEEKKGTSRDDNKLGIVTGVPVKGEGCLRLTDTREDLRTKERGQSLRAD